MPRPQQQFNENAPDDQQRLDLLQEIFAAIPEGRALLDMAAENGFTILFNRKLGPDTRGRLNIPGREIYLNPDIPDNRLLNTLAHELRHLWQACRTEFNGNDVLSGSHIFVFWRVMEGDAIAFAARFSEKLQAETGIAIPRCVFAANEKTDMAAVFLHFQTTPTAQKYDQDTLAHLQSILAEIAAERISKDSLAEIFNYASAPLAPDASIVNVTVSGLDDADVKYLDYKTLQDLSDAVLPHVHPETLRKAEALVQDIKRSAGLAAGFIAPPAI